MMSIVFTIVSWVLTSIGRLLVFPKAGIAGWKGFIPIYGTFLLFKMGWSGGMYFVALIVSIVSAVMTWYNLALFGSVLNFVNFVISAVMYWNLSKKFGKGMGMTIGLILVPQLFLIILGADKNAEYEGQI